MFLKKTATWQPPPNVRQRTRLVGIPGKYLVSKNQYVIDLGRGAEIIDATSGKYMWDGGPSHCVAIMRTASLLEVVDKIQNKNSAIAH